MEDRPAYLETGKASGLDLISCFLSKGQTDRQILLYRVHFGSAYVATE